MSAEGFAAVRREVALHGFKWDPHLEDQETLAAEAIVLGESAWDVLARGAEALDREALDAERELVGRPELHGILGLPWRVRRALRGATFAEGPRVARYDFHWTRAGWRISESNCDVPGGHVEASAFPALVRARLARETGARLRCVGDPARSVAEAVASAMGGRDRVVALVHATAYSDDRQVMELIAARLAGIGVAARPAAPDHLVFGTGGARLPGGEIVGAVVRFFPGEWLPNLGARCHWREYYSSEHITQMNPASSLVVQSKRFPLAWDWLTTPLPTWRSLLPETRDPREVPAGPDWVLKPALGRVGEGIALEGVTPDRDLRAARRWARWLPSAWAAQERFESVALEGGWHACLGVFVVAGRAAGCYGRLSRKPLVDMGARDAAVLVEEAPRDRVVEKVA